MLEERHLALIDSDRRRLLGAVTRLRDLVLTLDGDELRLLPVGVSPEIAAEKAARR